MARPLVLVGTGTSVGKTYVGERLLRALSLRHVRAAGYKPIETGLPTPDGSSDADRLHAAASFHVAPSPRRWVFRDPVSPHLAARLQGESIDIPAVRAAIRQTAAAAPFLIVELPGGAFSPLSNTTTGAALLHGLAEAVVLLVAADRLGVLHDVAATSLACSALGLPLLGVVLSAPPLPDASTGTNQFELPHVTSTPVVASLPRRPASDPIELADPCLGVADYVLAACSVP